MWKSWSGWAISAATDTTTPGYTNQYSSITGAGVDGSRTYATTFVAGESLIATTGAAKGGVVDGFYINNATYTYLSMKEGDDFAKKFGGEDGTDPDYLYVSIKEYGNRNVTNDSIIFYLADYRSDNPAEDYIINEWTYISLESFNNVDTLSFTLHSSDTGANGMNTPGYFCIDDFTTTDMALTSVEEPSDISTHVFPNPTTGQVRIESPESVKSIIIYDYQGQNKMSFRDLNQDFSMDLSALQSGSYFLEIQGQDGYRTTQKIIKL